MIMRNKINTRMVSVPVLLFLMSFPLSVRAEEGRKKPVIQNITIVRENVFSPDDNPLGITYPIVRRLHVTTRERIIKQELLFQKGDILDEELIQETERNLRRLNYLERARVSYEVNPEGDADVTIHTKDSWSLNIGVTLSRQEGRTNYGLLLEEFNLFGYGKRLNSSWNRRERGDTGEIAYTENRIFGSRWTIGGTVNRGPAGTFHNALNIVRPFYSLDTKWSTGFSFNSEKFLRNENTESEFPVKSNTQSFTLSRALGERFNKLFASLGVSHEDEFSESFNETVNEISTSLMFRSFQFDKAQRLDLFERIEDIELGNFLGVRVGRAGTPFAEGRKFWKYSADQGARFSLTEGMYLFEKLSYTETKESGNWINRITEVELKGYLQKLPAQTIAFRVRGSRRNNLDPNEELVTLEESSGLRGYTSSDSISGERTLLFNLEDRVFSNLKILTVAFGGVVFLDGGGGWEENESIDLSDMEYSTGLGFRFGLTKSASSRVARIDFAFPLDGREFKLKNIVVSFGTNQIFPIN
jgi:outer membrane protein assembly factor BamA